MNKGFDDDSFMRYMCEQFEPMAYSHFVYELVENILRYAHKHEHVSKDQFVEFLADILPEVEFKEIAAFADDSILTAYGIQMKRAQLAKIDT